MPKASIFAEFFRHHLCPDLPVQAAEIPSKKVTNALDNSQQRIIRSP